MIDTKVIGTIAVDEGVVRIDVRGAGAVGLQLAGTFVATVQFEACIEDGSFVALNMVPSNSATAATSATDVGAWSANCGGYATVQARASAYTSGTVRVTLQTASSGGK